MIIVKSPPHNSASEVYGVPGISGGAGDASGVGDGSGSQHRNSDVMSPCTVYGGSVHPDSTLQANIQTTEEATGESRHVLNTMLV